MLIGSAFGAEQMLIQWPITKKLSQDFLCLRPEVDSFGIPQVRRFMILWLDGPYIPRGLQIDPLKTNEFAGASTAQQLKLYECPDLATHEWLYGEYLFFGGRLNRLRFSGVSSAPLKPSYRQQRVINFRRKQFIFNRPAKHRFYPGDLLVDVRAAPAETNHVFTYGLKGFGTELKRRTCAIKAAHGPQCLAKIVQFAGRRSVRAAVMHFGMFPKGVDDVADRWCRSTILRMLDATS